MVGDQVVLLAVRPDLVASLAAADHQSAPLDVGLLGYHRIVERYARFEHFASGPSILVLTLRGCFRLDPGGLVSHHNTGISGVPMLTAGASVTCGEGLYILPLKNPLRFLEGLKHRYRHR